MTTINLMIVASYGTCLVFLAAFALQRLFLALSAWRAAEPEMVLLTEGALPPVLVQVPLYNEASVARRIIRHVAELDYPRDRLHIQVLDDSNDETVGICREAVAEYAEQGVRIEHVRRPTREGFKAGALAYGLTCSEAPLVAIFDADFMPDRGFLRSLVGHFGDERVGAVQARWGHLNRCESALTRGQGFLLDGHFLNEHAGRFARDCFFNFNGTAGIWRRSCIEDAGGWSGRTITEDLDLSYRAQLRGWKFIFRGDVVVDAELPADSTAFKVQQHRWAKGSIETALLTVGPIWRAAGLTLGQRLEATLHLLGNTAYPVVMLLGLLMPWVLSIRFETEPGLFHLLDTLLFLSTTVVLFATYLGAASRAGLRGRELGWAPMAMSLGVGLAINNCRAMAEALVGYRTAFVRTPKRGAKGQRPTLSPQIKATLWQSVIEVAFGLYLATGMWVAFTHGRWLALPMVALFSGGFLILGVGSIYTSVKVMWLAWRHPVAAEPVYPERI